jgi:hypothetical protein
MIRKKLITLSCTLVLLANLAACGSVTNSSDEAKERKTENSTVATTEQVTPGEPVTVEPTTEYSYDIESELDYKIQAAMYE